MEYPLRQYHQEMIQLHDNNVVIITDIKNYRKVVLDHFGKDFIDKCKLVRHTNEQ